MMPWGWRHAYLNDPEGHEISLYWAGEQRMQKSVMKAAKQAGSRTGGDWPLFGESIRMRWTALHSLAQRTSIVCYASTH